MIHDHESTCAGRYNCCGRHRSIAVATLPAVQSPVQELKVEKGAKRARASGTVTPRPTDIPNRVYLIIEHQHAPSNHKFTP